MKKVLQKLPGYSFVGQYVGTSTFKQSSITFGGTFLNAVFGAIFYIIAARFLGPAGFGLLNVAIVTLTFVSDIGDLGTDTGLVNFISRNRGKDKQLVNRFLKFGLKIKIWVWLVVVVLGYLLSGVVASGIFDKPELTDSFKIVFLGVGSILAFSYIIHSLQAFEKFWQWSIIQVTTNALRLVLVIVIFYLGMLTIDSTLWIYIAVPFVGFVVGLKWLPKFWKVKNDNQVAKQFLHYNKWVAAFTLVAALSSRLDTFLSARLISAVEVGYYSAASQLVKIVPQVVVALGTVVAPKMASMSNTSELVKYLKKTQIMVLGIAVVGLMFVPVVLYLIPLIFGVEYIPTGPIFVILLLGMVVFLISVPVHNAVIYYFSYPKLFFYQGLGHLVLIAFLGWYLIGSYGAVGAAYTVLVGAVYNLMIPYIWVYKKLQK